MYLKKKIKKKRKKKGPCWVPMHEYEPCRHGTKARGYPSHIKK